MPNDKNRKSQVTLWVLLKDTMRSAEALFAEGTRLSAASSEEAAAATAPSKARAPAAGRGEASGPPLAYIKKRQELRDALLLRLAPALELELGARQKAPAMLALIAFVDERERTVLGALAQRWSLPSLQTELLGISDAGDGFFDELDDLLGRTDVFPLVFSVYLFCLKYGFEGRCKDKPEVLEKYVDRLKARLTEEMAPEAANRAAPAEDTHSEALRPRRIQFVSFPVRYYATAIGVVAACFLLLRCTSQAEVYRQAKHAGCLGERSSTHAAADE